MRALITRLFNARVLITRLFNARVLITRLFNARMLIRRLFARVLITRLFNAHVLITRELCAVRMCNVIIRSDLRYISSVIIHTDIQRPALKCPYQLKASTSKGKATGRVVWSVQVSDNSVDVDPNAVIVVRSSHESGQELPIGYTDIQVNATDQAGNVATCAWRAEVEGNIYFFKRDSITCISSRGQSALTFEKAITPKEKYAKTSTENQHVKFRPGVDTRALYDGFFGLFRVAWIG